MTSNLTLQDLVRIRYRSLRELAENLKWSYSKTRRIIRGEQSPDLNDIKALSAELNLRSPEDIAQVFSILSCPQNETF